MNNLSIFNRCCYLSPFFLFCSRQNINIYIIFFFFCLSYYNMVAVSNRTELIVEQLGAGGLLSRSSHGTLPPVIIHPISGCIISAPLLASAGLSPAGSEHIWHAPDNCSSSSSSSSSSGVVVGPPPKKKKKRKLYKKATVK